MSLPERERFHMISDSILLDKLTSYCDQPLVTQAALAACCKELTEKFHFDCVFIAHSSAPEGEIAVLAFDGKEEVVATCLYRLGVEERITLGKLPLKAFTDMTGKPVFNRSGSLRIQKPSSGVFMALQKPKKSYLLLGWAHQNSQPYDLKTMEEISIIWTAWQEILEKAVSRIVASGKVENPVSGGAVEPLEKKAPILVSAPIPKAGTVKDSRRPVVLVDEVTRLFNRDYFEESLTIEVERAKRYSRTLSLMFLSVTPLDPATALSDERVANQIAEILSKSLRRVDVICRLEPDLYGLILPDTANNTYGIIAKRIFKFFKEIMGASPRVFLNVSASTYPKHAADHKALFESAETLLRQAKEVGPNKAVLPD